jgi:hypothetical protein
VERSIVEHTPLPLLAPDAKATAAYAELADELLPAARGDSSASGLESRDAAEAASSTSETVAVAGVVRGA